MLLFNILIFWILNTFTPFVLHHFVVPFLKAGVLRAHSERSIIFHRCRFIRKSSLTSLQAKTSPSNQVKFISLCRCYIRLCYIVFHHLFQPFIGLNNSSLPSQRRICRMLEANHTGELTSATQRSLFFCTWSRVKHRRAANIIQHLRMSAHLWNKSTARSIY